MKYLFLTVIFQVLYNFSLFAQNATFQNNSLMGYNSFKPAIVTFKSGKTLKVQQANIFLKNSTLLYKHGTQIMQAKMDDIQYVDFDDRHYEHVDTVLAYRIDSVGDNLLLCAPLLDLEAFQRQMANNREITHLNLGEVASIVTTELKTEEDNGYPIFNRYLFYVKGKVIKAQDRPCLQVIPKNRRREYKTLLGSENFNWNNPDCLRKVLNLISKE